MLDRLVSDWIKDKDGTIWLIGVKSFTVSKFKLLKHIVKGKTDGMKADSLIGKASKILKNIDCSTTKLDQMTHCKNCRNNFLTPITNVASEHKLNVNKMK